MNTFIEKMDALGKQFAIFQMKMEEQKENSLKSAGEVIDSIDDEITRLEKQTIQQLEVNTSQILFQLLVAQKNFISAKEEIKNYINMKEIPSAKQKARNTAEASADFAAFAISHAILSIDEAIFAFYAAIEQMERFDNKYQPKRRNSTNE